MVWYVVGGKLTCAYGADAAQPATACQHAHTPVPSPCVCVGGGGGLGMRGGGKSGRGGYMVQGGRKFWGGDLAWSRRSPTHL